MAVPKVCGIETEYGVAPAGLAGRQPGARVVDADQRLRRAPQGRLGLRGRVARDATPAASPATASQPPEIETHLVNTVLTNGARYYVDHAHPEYSTPECADALELVRADKAGERILARSMQAARRLLGPGPGDRRLQEQLRRQGQLVRLPRELPRRPRRSRSSTLVRNLIPWFVTRQVFTGAGKVGSENGAAPVDYQISQRADFFEEEVGLETTLKRPHRQHPRRAARRPAEVPPPPRDRRRREPVRGRDVPQGRHDRDRARDDRGRLHRQGPLDRRPGPRDAHACRTTRRAGRRSSSPTVGSCTAVELQWEFLRLAQKYADETGLEACGGEAVGRRRARPLGSGAHRSSSATRWASTASSTGSRSTTCSRPTRRATASSWDDPKLALLDLQYHDVRPERSLYERLVRAGKVERLVDEADVIEAMTEPPGHDPGVLPGPLPAPAGPTRWSPPTGTA